MSNILVEKNIFQQSDVFELPFQQRIFTMMWISYNKDFNHVMFDSKSITEYYDSIAHLN